MTQWEPYVFWLFTRHIDYFTYLFWREFTELLVTKYKYHFIFYLTENVEKPVIIGVIHERRDVVSRLSERLA